MSQYNITLPMQIYPLQCERQNRYITRNNNKFTMPEFPQDVKQRLKRKYIRQDILLKFFFSLNLHETGNSCTFGLDQKFSSLVDHLFFFTIQQ